MNSTQQRRGWILIAVLAIGFALVLLLALHGGSGNAADFVAILPLLLVAVLSPLGLLGRLTHEYAGRVQEAPVLASRFQRPPPIRRG